jgi:hypothetical protein
MPGAKARVDIVGFMRGLKPPPPSVPWAEGHCSPPEESFGWEEWKCQVLGCGGAAAGGLLEGDVAAVERIVGLLTV